MEDEMYILKQNEIWKVVSLIAGKQVVAYRWMHTVKLNPDGTLTCLKACLVVKGYSQTHGVYYLDIFSVVVKIASIRLIISLATIHHWPLH